MSNTQGTMTIASLGAEWLSVRAGGLNRYTEGLSRSLVGLGVNQSWLVAGEGNPMSYPGLAVKAVASPESSLRTRWRAFREAWPAAAENADLAVSHFALYAHPVRNQLKRKPHVVHFHGPWAAESEAEGAGRIATWLKSRLERGVYRTGDRFVVLSQAFGDILCSRYGVDPERVRVVQGGVDFDRFATPLSRVEAREHLGWPNDRPIILCVRRLVRRMGLEQLVDAIDRLRSIHPDALLLIAGKGPLASLLQQRIDRAGLAGSVRLMGFVPDDELPLAYRAADVSVVPSQTLEGFGLIIPESLAAGTPALVTPVGGMPEVVTDLHPSLVLGGCGVDYLSDGLDLVLRGHLVLPDAETCRTYARERFAWPKVAARVLAVYREAIVAHE